MEALLALLKDGRSRSVEQLAAELNTTAADILRRMEFLERMGRIRRALNTGAGCNTGGCGSTTCAACSAHGKRSAPHACAGCLPDGGFAHMGKLWEVVS